MRRLREHGPALKQADPSAVACQWHKSRIARVAIGVVVSAVLVFSAAHARPGTAAQSSKPSAEPAGNAQSGRKLFVKYGCYECHGYEGQGSIATGPRVGPDPLPLQALIAYVRKPAGEMPPYTDKVISDQELTDIHAFLASLPEPPKNLPLLK
jgi:mono/diheme cytochrome c family protein